DSSKVSLFCAGASHLRVILRGAAAPRVSVREGPAVSQQLLLAGAHFLVFGFHDPAEKNRSAAQKRDSSSVSEREGLGSCSHHGPAPVNGCIWTMPGRREGRPNIKRFQPPSFSHVSGHYHHTMSRCLFLLDFCQYFSSN